MYLSNKILTKYIILRILGKIFGQHWFRIMTTGWRNGRCIWSLCQRPRVRSSHMKDNGLGYQDAWHGQNICVCIVLEH